MSMPEVIKPAVRSNYRWVVAALLFLIYTIIAWALASLKGHCRSA